MSAIIIFAIASTCFGDGSIGVQWTDYGKNIYYADSGYKKKGGPPPHAPAHGYRAKHQYQYYPACNVYHDPDRGLYFYIKGDGWEVGASLPTDLQARLGASVSIDLDTDKPYEFNAEHLKQYPKDKYETGKTDKNKG